MASFTSRQTVVVLSRGGTWNPNPWDPPYTMPSDQFGGAWPASGATSNAVFYDTAGGVLATIAGTVTAGGIAFTAAPAVVDLIPNGANFEIFLTDAGANTYQIRFGKVIRREAEFLQAPPITVIEPVKFQDSWPTLGVRSSWIRMPPAVAMIVHDNSGASLPNSLGAPFSALTVTDAVMRWYRPLNSDAVQVKINTLDLHTYTGLGFSRFHVILCADNAFTSYLELQFEATLATHRNTLQFAVGSAPTTIALQGSPLVNTIGANSYTISYDDTTDTISVYEGAALTPLLSYTDTLHAKPHGPGFRYLGLRATNGTFTNGLQATSWQAMDVV